LTLDHLTPYSKGGSNDASNLITCCHRCNSSRGNRALRTFCRSVAGYLNHGITAEQILSHVTNSRRRTLDVEAAKELISRRGGFTAALKG
jgi:hypothetical protein